MRQALLLYNPAAGRMPIEPFIGGIIRPLRSAGWKIEVVETISGRDATRMAHQAAVEKYDGVFAIGGDGTVGQVATGLINTETALAVLPGGTMNVWAGELGLPSFDLLHMGALRQNARLLARAPVFRVDVGTCNRRPFLLWAGCGLDAQVIRQLEPRPRIEKYIAVPRFFAASVWTAAVWHGMNLRVWNGDQSVQGHFLLAVATNIRKYAGGIAVLSPEAYIDDGEMDLWLMSGNSVADALRHFFDLLAGRHLTSDEARKLPFSRVRIESETEFSVQMDGEPVLSTSQVDITVEKQALHVLLPPSAYRLLKSRSDGKGI
ncbi:MAG TPA: diacylglycerol kinase family protein [Anaerolineales bacterium]